MRRPSYLRETASLVCVCLAVAAALGCREPPSDRDPDEPEPEPDGPVAKPDFQYTGECRRPTFQDLASDPVVEWAMKEALRKAVMGKERSYFFEEGGWIYQCRTAAPEGGGHRYFLDARVVEKDPTDNQKTSMRMQEARYRPHMPGNPDCRTVGQFHVHPTSGKSEPSGRSDVPNAARRGIPSFIVNPQEKAAPPPADGYDRLPSWKAFPYGGWSEAGKKNLSWNCACDREGERSDASGTGAETSLCSGRYFGRLTGEIGTPEPEMADMGPLEWPRRRADRQAAAIRADAEVLGHIVSRTMGIGASPESVDELEEVMVDAFRGPMNLFQERQRSLRGPFYGLRRHDVVDRSAVGDRWDGRPVLQEVSFSHAATGAGGRIDGDIEVASRGAVFERAAAVRSFGAHFEGATDGRVTSLPGGSDRGHLGSDGDARGIFVWGVVVEARRDLALRLTLRADARGDAQATGIVVPTAVLGGDALVAFPAMSPGRPGAPVSLMATSAAAALGGPGGVAEELERQMAEMSPEQRRMVEETMGGDPGEALRSMMDGLGGAMGGVADGWLRLPGPPEDRESLLYYVMTVVAFELEGQNGDDGRWRGEGEASLAVRLEAAFEPHEGETPPLPGLGEIEERLGSPERGERAVSWLPGSRRPSERLRPSPPEAAGDPSPRPSPG